jgi:serine/threonine protein kinase
MCGTPEYFAPEMIRQDVLYNGDAIDWWTLGILTYELLVGRTPFASPTQRSTYDRILHHDISFPRSVKVSAEGRDFVERLLQRDLGTRLGCAKQGAAEVVNHPWFACVPDSSFSDLIRMR